MQLTREEVQSLLDRLIEQGTFIPDDLYDETCETLYRCVLVLPSAKAVKRDAQRGKERRSADQTG